ncbi:hypothetical protein BSF41_40710 [Flavobacterium sp. ACN2]|jgi:hypothetical protein|uniref:hypothetical protein n=1 Tax=Flavobacterium sp. ACN2 TaxID=1975676 RepID=UPI000BB3C2DE|nr:hypothetical protein [Flavobacterium sp. ACN2]PBI84743.1 hypothetical protein BSF41_40710 [Flavobacterium sp. ACN2]
MNTNHNRIKVADLETNEHDKILITNSNGELEFSDLTSALDFKTINGESILGSGNIDLSNKQDISNQLEVNSSQVIPSNWHGKTVLFTTNCTITVPASLPQSFIFNGITLPGVSLTWAITAPHTWLFGVPSVTSEKQIFTFTKRGATNGVLLLGV